MRPVAVVAAAAVLLGGTVVLAGPAAAAPQHVGVVVRFADGNVGAGCTTAGGSGLAVLGRLHSVTMGAGPYTGFVTKIDGVGAAQPDNTHYWSYWHSGGAGGWTYAGSGAGGYTPEVGTVEGWSFVNGQNSAPTPPSYTYASLCGRLDPSAAPSTPARTTPARTTSARPHPAIAPPRVVRTHRAAGLQPAATSAPPTPRPSRRTAPAAHAPRTTGARRTTGAPRTTGTPATTAPPVSTDQVPTAAPVADAAGPHKSSAGFPAWGTVVALLVVLALGATAFTLTRRRAG
jgi:hypothetical protein